MASRGSLWRAVTIALPAIALALAQIAACGTEQPGAAGADGLGNLGSYCGTPNEGCECYEPGKTVPCGEVKHVSSDGFVACSMGHRQCLGGQWGACVGEHDVVRPKSFTAGPIDTLGLGTGAACGSDGGGPGNPCDPYCNAFVDDPVGLVLDGGLVVTPEGGLTIPPTVPDGGGTPGVFTSTSSGVSNCSGVTNIVGSICTPPGLTACQQDFRCDTFTNTCIWNGGPGYYDPTVPGVDLTVGAPCGPSGAGSATAPVCNRGSATLPVGSTITLHVTTSGLPDGCTDLGTPTYTFTLGGDLAPGACTSFGIGNGPGNKFITVNAGAPGAVAEAPGYCANNSAGFKADGAPSCGACTTCNTQIKGKVYDPSGGPSEPGSNNMPLAGVTVFQPAGPLKTFTDGVQCDTCASLASPTQTAAVTDATGSFTLNNVSPGASVPIVVQSGRWRRTVTLPVTNACGVNTYTPGTFRMPRNRTDGLNGQADIPKIAILMGSQENLGCMLLRMGISSSEIKGRQGPGDANRFQIWSAGGGMHTSPAAASDSGFYNASVLSEYAGALWDCDLSGRANSASTTEKNALRDWANAGGRIFMDHVPAQYLLDNGSFPVTSTWVNAGAPYGSSAKGWVPTGTAPQQLFHDWLANVGGSADYGAGWIKIAVPARHAIDPQPPPLTTTWVRGQSSNYWGAGAPPGPPSSSGNYTLSYSFETPYGAPTTCGRVIFNGMHVSELRGTSGTFPSSCNTSLPLIPSEIALEYQLFQLTACALGGGPPPVPPPPPPPLPTVVFVRDYEGVCGTGERIKWGPLYWQSIIPPGTNVKFRAATADTLGALPAAPPIPLAPTTADVGTASMTVAAPAWDCTGCPSSPVTVDSQLLADTGVGSKRYLRVYMEFNPTATVPPTLTAWRQIYDCVPAE